MSNPDSSTPSIQALDKAVKPAGYSSWDDFRYEYGPAYSAHKIALAYAADLDKADKVGRVVRDYWTANGGGTVAEVMGAARELILPEPIDPDLLEAEKIAERAHDDPESTFTSAILAALKRGRELANSTSGAGLERSE